MNQNDDKLPVVDDGDETFFKYWIDDGLKIRTCHECKISQFKSPDDGVWIVYFTRERLFWLCDRVDNGQFDHRCTLCKKFYDPWRESK